VHLPGSSSAFIGFPHHSIESASRFLPRTRLSTGRLTRLQLFRYVHASQFARLPDRSYRCKFPRRAAEAFTSEQNVRRYLRTHRTCYPADYRQLPERGLSPRKIRSLVGCSRMMPTFPPPPLSFRTVSFPAVRLEGWLFRQRLSPCQSGQADTGHTLFSVKFASALRTLRGHTLRPALCPDGGLSDVPPCEEFASSAPEVLAPVWVLLSQSINA
jgi:hypothetical protein